MHILVAGSAANMQVLNIDHWKNINMTKFIILNILRITSKKIIKVRQDVGCLNGCELFDHSRRDTKQHKL